MNKKIQKSQFFGKKDLIINKKDLSSKEWDKIKSLKNEYEFSFREKRSRLMGIDEYSSVWIEIE